MKSHPHHRSFSFAIAVSIIGLAMLGCGKKAAHEAKAHGGHVHEAKHGGVAVELGEHEYQMEFTFGDTPGVLRAYIMDGHMNDYVRIDLPSFSATANVNGSSYPLVFQATTSSATGEKMGDTALFEATEAWLAARPAIELAVPVITVRGHTYSNLTVHLPAAAQP
jgi:hypothetical protein